MAKANESSIEIIELDQECQQNGELLSLEIDDAKRALLVNDNGKLSIHWGVYGPMQLDEAKVFILGLLDLLIAAENINLPAKPRKKR